MNRSRLLFAFSVLSATLAACSSASTNGVGDAPTVAPVASDSDSAVRAELVAAVESDPSVLDHLAVLRASGWVVEGWSEAKVERVALPPSVRAQTGRDAITRLSLPLVRPAANGAAAHAHLLCMPADGARGETRVHVAVRPDDAVAAAMLTLDTDEETYADDAADDATSAGQVACGRVGGCATAMRPRPDGPPSVPTWTCRYVSHTGFNPVCFDDTFNLLSQYHVLTARTGPRNGRTGMYATYSGCGVQCPVPNTTRGLFVCGQVPHPGCTGL